MEGVFPVEVVVPRSGSLQVVNQQRRQRNRVRRFFCFLPLNACRFPHGLVDGHLGPAFVKDIAEEKSLALAAAHAHNAAEANVLHSIGPFIAKARQTTKKRFEMISL